MQMNYLIRDKTKFDAALRHLDIFEHVELKKIESIDELFDFIDRCNSKDEILKTMSINLIKNHIYKLLENDKVGIVNTKVEVTINSTITFKNVKGLKDKLNQGKEWWKLPTTIISSKSFLLSFGVFVLWGAAIFFLVKKNPEIFVVTFSFFSITLLLLVLILPEIFLRYFLPNFFGVEKFINIKTFQDLTNELYRLNRDEYLNDGYRRLREDIFYLYGPF